MFFPPTNPNFYLDGTWNTQLNLSWPYEFIFCVIDEVSTLRKRIVELEEKHKQNEVDYSQNRAKFKHLFLQKEGMAVVYIFSRINPFNLSMDILLYDFGTFLSAWS